MTLTPFPSPSRAMINDLGEQLVRNSDRGSLSSFERTDTRLDLPRRKNHGWLSFEYNCQYPGVWISMCGVATERC